MLKAEQDEATRAIIQEKDDMLEQLQSELGTKRAEIADAQRTIADMKVELDIMEKKQIAFVNERDVLKS